MKRVVAEMALSCQTEAAYEEAKRKYLDFISTEGLLAPKVGKTTGIQYMKDYLSRFVSLVTRFCNVNNV